MSIPPNRAFAFSVASLVAEGSLRSTGRILNIKANTIVVLYTIIFTPEYGANKIVLFIAISEIRFHFAWLGFASPFLTTSSLSSDLALRISLAPSLDNW